jgi:hypothetical protein
MSSQATITEFHDLTEGSVINVRANTFLTNKATIVLLNREQRDRFVVLVDSEDPNDDGVFADCTELLHLSADRPSGAFIVPSTGGWYVFSNNRECTCQMSFS